MERIAIAVIIWSMISGYLGSRQGGSINIERTWPVLLVLRLRSIS